jgi:hypothetical protein
MNDEQNETIQTIPAPVDDAVGSNNRNSSKTHKERNGSCQFLEERFRRHH